MNFFSTAVVAWLCASTSVVDALDGGRIRNHFDEVGKMHGSGSGSSSGKGNRCVPGAIVIVNRVSGTITVLSDDGDQFDVDLPIPRGGGDPEPMYVVAAANRVYVGDRANDRIVVFDAKTFEPVDSIPAGDGFFHMWSDGRRLWVVNDVDLTMTVIDLELSIAIKTVELPDDIGDDGGKPHDLVVTPSGEFAFVSILYADNSRGGILKYDAASYELLDSIEVGDDPHLGATFLRNIVISPQQGNGTVTFHDQDDLSVLGNVSIPNAHGIGIDPDGSRSYVTNILGLGTDALYTINNRDLTVEGSPVDTPHPTPHNVVVTPDKRLFVTHSGALADKVTEFDVLNGSPVFTREYTVGLNPFGLAYTKGTCLL